MSLLIGIGTCEVVFDSSAQAFLPMLVSSSDLPRANGYLFAAEVVTGSILGLSIGAFLFSRAHALPFAVNAASFALAAILIASIKVERTTARSTSASSAPRWARRCARCGTTGCCVCWRSCSPSPTGLMFGHGIFVKYADVELGVTGSGTGCCSSPRPWRRRGRVFGHR